jgi:hypothetical protein
MPIRDFAEAAMTTCTGSAGPAESASGSATGGPASRNAFDAALAEVRAEDDSAAETVEFQRADVENAAATPTVETFSPHCFARPAGYRPP